MTNYLNKLYREIISHDVIRKISATFVTRILLIIIGFITSIIITRKLGPEGRGLFALAMTIASLGVQFGNFGLHSSNTYYVSKDKSLLPSLVSNTIFASLTFGGIISIIFGFSLSYFNYSSSLNQGLITLIFLWIPFGLAFLLMQNILIGIQSIRLYNILEAFQKVFILALVVIFISFNLANPTWFFGANWLALIASFVIVIIYLLKITKHLPRPNFTLLKQNLAYGIKAYLAALFAFLLLKIDIVMVKYFLNDASTGFYSLAANLAEMIYLLPSVVGLIIFPKLCALKNDQDKWQLSKKTNIALVLTMLPIVIIAIFTAQFFINLLYGEAFLPSAKPFWILAPAMIAYGWNNILVNFLASIGLPWLSVIIWIGIAGLNVLLNIIFIPKLGIQGAALASFICYILVGFFQWGFIKRRILNHAG